MGFLAGTPARGEGLDPPSPAPWCSGVCEKEISEGAISEGDCVVGGSTQNGGARLRMRERGAPEGGTLPGW